MMIDEISGRYRRRWRGSCGSAGHSTGRSAPDEMAAYELHHPGDIMYRDHGIGQVSGVPAVMVGGPDFFAFEPILQN